MLSGGRKKLIEQINVINDKSQVFIDQSSKDRNCIVGPYRLTLKQEVIDSINKTNADIDKQNEERDKVNEDTVKSNKNLIKENKKIISENEAFEDYNMKTVNSYNEAIDKENENNNNDNSMPDLPNQTPIRTQIDKLE